MTRQHLADLAWELATRVSWVVAALGLLVTSVEVGMLIDNCLGAWA